MLTLGSRQRRGSRASYPGLATIFGEKEADRPLPIAKDIKYIASTSDSKNRLGAMGGGAIAWVSDSLPTLKRMVIT